MSIRSLRQLTDEQLERIGLEYGEIGELKSELEATSHGMYCRIWHSSSFFQFKRPHQVVIVQNLRMQLLLL
jgi:hypothetical protein